MLFRSAPHPTYPIPSHPKYICTPSPHPPHAWHRRPPTGLDAAPASELRRRTPPRESVPRVPAAAPARRGVDAPRAICSAHRAPGPPPQGLPRASTPHPFSSPSHLACGPCATARERFPAAPAPSFLEARGSMLSAQRPALQRSSLAAARTQGGRRLARPTGGPRGVLRGRAGDARARRVSASVEPSVARDGDVVCAARRDPRPGFLGFWVSSPSKPARVSRFPAFPLSRSPAPFPLSRFPETTASVCGRAVVRRGQNRERTGRGAGRRWRWGL